MFEKGIFGAILTSILQKKTKTWFLFGHLLFIIY